MIKRLFTCFFVSALGAGSLLPGFAQAQLLPEIFLEQRVSGLQSPVVITHAGDGSGRQFIAEQAGVVKIVQNGSLLSTPFLDISARVLLEGERGLLGLVFPPNFIGNNYFYVFYTSLSGDNVVARYAVSADPNRADRQQRTDSPHRAPSYFYQPQRRPIGLRAQRWLPLHRHRRRRRRRRSVRTTPRTPNPCSARSCASTSNLPRHRGLRTRFRPTNPFVGLAGFARRSGPSACATPGASPSTGSPATSTSATSARMSSRRWTSSRPAARAGRTTAGTFWRARPVSPPRIADCRPATCRR